MNMSILFLLLLAAASVVAGQGQHPKIINILRQKSTAAGELADGVNCLSWRVGVEAHNIIGWDAPPDECVEYIKDYILSGQYSADAYIVAKEAIEYVSTLTLPRDNANVWVFDIDETALSNVAYILNQTTDIFSPALPQTQQLYNKLLSLGINVVFLTGRPETRRNMTEYNLREVGYRTWSKLILRSDIFANHTAKSYKSIIRENLENEGYRIVGNIGDQWSDITGTSTGWRVFKLPNPFYYLP